MRPFCRSSGPGRPSPRRRHSGRPAVPALGARGTDEAKTRQPTGSWRACPDVEPDAARAVEPLRADRSAIPRWQLQPGHRIWKADQRRPRHPTVTFARPTFISKNANLDIAEKPVRVATDELVRIDAPTKRQRMLIRALEARGYGQLQRCVFLPRTSASASRSGGSARTRVQ